jgi:hypothetical protein
MNPLAEDGGGPAMALTKDCEEQPGAASLPQRRAPVDGFAVASLVSGILALIPLAVIFGMVALSRVARTGARGRALAIAGLVLGGTWAVAAPVTAGVLIAQRPSARPVQVTLPKVFSLRTGECLNSAPSGAGLHVLGCGQPHDAEVFATFRVGGQRYPGAAALQLQAAQGCGSRISGYMNPQLSAMLDESYVYPSPGAWAAGERTVICTVRGTDGPLTGSVRTTPG